MNDIQFVEASKMLAGRMQENGGASLEEQLAYGFRLAVSRHPKAAETAILKQLYETQLKRFESKPEEAEDLLKVGEKQLEKSLNNNKTAALTIVANTILNHDETYMKR